MVPKLGEVFQLCDLSNDLGKSHHHFCVHPSQGSERAKRENAGGEPFVAVEMNTIISL